MKIHSLRSSTWVRLFTTTVVLGTTLLGVGRCTSADKQAASRSPDPTWAGSMQDMAWNLDQLMPYIFGREEYLDPKNKSEIQNRLQQFAAATERVPKHIGEAMLGRDPLIPYSLARLKTNAKHALVAFQEGQTEFSRNMARENIGLCFSCHSTQKFGPQDSPSTQLLNSNFRIFPIERADYYVATRQFDKALEVLKGVVKSPKELLDDPHGQLNALKKYLFIQVRVKKDPAPAIDLVHSYLSWQKLPYFMAADAKGWLESLTKWRSEGQDSRPAFDKAERLLLRAETQTQGYETGLVDRLRASALLHESLPLAKTSHQKARAYRLLGETYEALSDVEMWQLPEFYFEACIRILPGSREAFTCYKDYERSIILGFSGSAGTFVPKEERELMEELRALAEPPPR